MALMEQSSASAREHLRTIAAGGQQDEVRMVALQALGFHAMVDEQSRVAIEQIAHSDPSPAIAALAEQILQGTGGGPF